MAAERGHNAADEHAPQLRAVGLFIAQFTLVYQGSMLEKLTRGAMVARKFHKRL